MTRDGSKILYPGDHFLHSLGHPPLCSMRLGSVLELTLGFSELNIPVENRSLSNGHLDWTELALNVNRQDYESVRVVWENLAYREPPFWSKLDLLGVKTLVEYARMTSQRHSLAEWESCGPGPNPALTENEVKIMQLDTCAYIAICFEWLVNPLYLPTECREKFLQEQMITILGIRRLPPQWLTRASSHFIGSLTGKHLNIIPINAFDALITVGRCNQLGSSALYKLELDRWSRISPKCLASINNLGKLAIPEPIISKLRFDIFQDYNGPLSYLVTKSMTPNQVKAYAKNIPKDQHICGSLKLRNLNASSASKITPRCLYGHLFLNRGKDDRMLTIQWTALARAFRKLPEEMMDIVAYIYPKDFAWMTKAVTHRVFCSDTAINNLPSQGEDALKIARSVKLLPFHFKFLNERSSSLARLFLSAAKDLPDDTFALFTAQDYTRLDADQLLPTLVDRPNFGLLIENMSRYSTSHYCETLRTFKDYLEKLWLRGYSGPNCWNALSFGQQLESLQSLAPELGRGELGWEEFVQKDAKRWGLMPPNILKDLLQMEGFCRAFKDNVTLEFLRKQPDFVLGMIGGKCAVYFCHSITGDLASKLADDAFKFFTFELFSRTNLKLENLSPNQMEHISRGLPDGDEAHIFKHLTSEELGRLDKALLWAITPSQLSIHFNTGKHPDSSLLYYAIDRAFAFSDKGFVQLAMHLCELSLNKGTLEDLECAVAIERYMCEETEEVWSLVKEQLSLANFIKLSVAIARDPTDLFPLFVRAKFPAPEVDFYLALEPSPPTFNREKSSFILRNKSLAFANPKTRIFIGSNNVSRFKQLWIDEMLTDLCDNATIATVEQIHSKMRKFSWVVGHEVGFIAGLLFGKALQEKVPLPFNFEESFWALLPNPTAKKIDDYYEQTFQKEREDFISSMIRTDPSLSPDLVLVPYFRIENIEFSTFDAPTNVSLSSSRSNEFIEAMMIVSKEENIKAKYFDPLDAVIRLEFRKVVQKFIDGLGATLRTEIFPYVRKVPYLAELFTSENLTEESILKDLVFENALDTIMIESLINRCQLSLSDVFKSFLKSLTPLQLIKFIKVWTGVSYPRKGLPLKISSLGSNLKCISREKFNYVSGINLFSRTIPKPTFTSTNSSLAFASTTQYHNLVVSAAHIQFKMLYPTLEVPTILSSKSFIRIKYESFDSEVDPNFQTLFIHPQSANDLFHSLAVLINRGPAGFLGRVLRRRQTGGRGGGGLWPMERPEAPSLT